VNKIISVCGIMRLSTTAASAPFNSGMERSSKTKSG
jgi:hypothetical protein